MLLRLRTFTRFEFCLSDFVELVGTKCLVSLGIHASRWLVCTAFQDHEHKLTLDAPGVRLMARVITGDVRLPLQ